MAYNSLAELFTAIADSIRGKNGRTERIIANDFPVAIDGIINGRAIIDRTITEISDNTLETVGDYAFCACNSLLTVDFPNAKSVGNFSFSMAGLTSVNLPAVASTGIRAFYSCKSLPEITLPSLSVVNQYAFSECSKLVMADLPVAHSISLHAFSGCKSLTALILRSKTMCTLGATNALANTPIASGTGYVYVPSAPLADYQADSVWVTSAAQFRALEDYTVDGTIFGALDETKI